MSSNDSGSEEEAPSVLYKFTLVQFVHRGRKRKLEEIDIVPSKWLKFDYSRDRCTTRYAPADSSPEDYQVLHDLVRMLADAPESYTSYSINIKGRAETYEEALQKLEKLQCQNHVFSLGSEESESEIQKKMEDSVKQQNLQRQVEELKKVMESKDPDAEDDDQQSVPKKKLQKGGRKKSSTKSTEPKSSGSQNNSSKEASLQRSIDPKPSTSSSFDSLRHAPEGNRSTDNGVENQPASTPSTLSTFKGPLGIGVASTSNVHEVCPQSNSVVSSLELPVIDCQNVTCSTPFEYAVMAQIAHLTQVVENMQTRQNAMSNFLLDKRVVNIINNKVDFKLKYNYDIPFSTKEKFNEFNEDLKENNFLKNDTCYELAQHMDKDYVLTKSYVNMLKRFLTKNVVIQYTAMRVSKSDKSKEQFKGNEFSKLMDVVAYGTRAEKGLVTDQKDLNSALSDVLCNAKKWTDTP